VLPKVRGALHLAGSFADLLHGWQQQGHQRRQHRDDDEEFDE